MSKMTYLRVADILVDRASTALGPLGMEDVPEEAEPLVEEGCLGRGHRQLGGGQIIGQFGINVILGVGVHGIVAEAVADGVAVLVATAVAIFLDVDLDVALEELPRAVEHVVSDEVLVDVRVEQGPLVFR